MSNPVFVEVETPKQRMVVINVQDIIKITPRMIGGKELTELTIRSINVNGVSGHVIMDLNYPDAKAFLSHVIDIQPKHR